MAAPKKLPAEPPPDALPDSAAQDARPGESVALNHFLDVPVNVSVELARKKIKMRDVLNLQVDMVIQMNQSAGENVDLRLNGLAVGNGEIVVIEDMMGLRVTDFKSRTLEPE